MFGVGVLGFRDSELRFWGSNFSCSRVSCLGLRVHRTPPRTVAAPSWPSGFPDKISSCSWHPCSSDFGFSVQFYVKFILFLYYG